MKLKNEELIRQAELFYYDICKEDNLQSIINHTSATVHGDVVILRTKYGMPVVAFLLEEGSLVLLGQPYHPKEGRLYGSKRRKLREE